MQTQGKNLSSTKAWATSWLCLVLTGCSWLWGPWLVHPVTSGSHSIATQCWRGPKGPLIYAVWSARPIASQYVAGELLQRGNRVVERARLEQLRSEEHTSELQSLAYLVCRLLLEKKKNTSVHASETIINQRSPMRNTT